VNIAKKVDWIKTCPTKIVIKSNPLCHPGWKTMGVRFSSGCLKNCQKPARPKNSCLLFGTIGFYLVL
jgi:hypothetical protein